MSTAFHSQTDGLAEKANQIVERYFRTFAAANERRWDRLLSLAEFSYNSHVHQAHGMSPFEADLGYNARMPLDVMAAATKPRPGGGFVAVNFATKMNDILDQLTNALKDTQATQVQEANKKQQPHNFQPGDRIMLNTKNLPLGYANATGNTHTTGQDVNRIDTDGLGTRLSKALRQKYTDPLTLGNQLRENTFELDDIPDHLLVHKTSNVSLFKWCEIDNTQQQVPPPPVRVAKSTVSEYEIERIADCEWSTTDVTVCLLVE
jgi:hypothetical protein